MKPIITLLAFTVFCLPFTQGQTLAYQEIAVKQNSEISYRTNSVYRDYKPRNKKMIIGGIMAGSGGIFALSGLCMYTLGDGHGDPYATNHGLQSAGIGFIIGGGAMIATGCILAIVGRSEKNRGYGFEIVAPKYNEIGLAYNF